MPIQAVMGDDLDEVTANLAVLIHAELEVQHRLIGHPSPVPECPVCAARRRPDRATDRSLMSGAGRPTA
jgi:hypothetical protein